MKKRNNPPDANASPGARVVLKPILGVRPRTYMAVIYSAVLVAVLFILFLYDGLFSPGAEVTIETLPRGASVRVDGRRVGYTPCTVFVPAGKRSFALSKPFFGTFEKERDVPSRLVGSLFAKKKDGFFVRLALKSEDGLFESAHREFSSWTLTGEPSATYSFPPVLSEAVEDYYLSSEGKPSVDRLPEAFLLSAAKNVANEGVFRDYLRAAALAGSKGKAMSPAGAARTAAFFARLYASSDYAALWLAEVLPEKAAAEIVGNHAVAARLDSLFAGIKRELSVPVAAAGASIRIGSMDFVPVPAGNFVLGWSGTSPEGNTLNSLNAPRKTGIGGFYLAATEVSESEYADFIKEVPLYSPSNRKKLAEEGLAEQGYLESWKDSANPPKPSYPVREVSQFAARAYCEWLGRKYPAYIFFLPSEEQWEWAATLNDGKGKRPASKELASVREAEPGAIGLRNMLGNVWEWCSDWFYPADYIFPAESRFSGAEISVRGGCWLNRDENVGVSTRASQPPTWCTPYLGFRVAAVRK